MLQDSESSTEGNWKWWYSRGNKQTAGNQEICERFGLKSSDWSIFNL